LRFLALLLKKKRDLALRNSLKMYGNVLKTIKLVEKIEAHTRKGKKYR